MHKFSLHRLMRLGYAACLATVVGALSVPTPARGQRVFIGPGAGLGLMNNLMQSQMLQAQSMLFTMGNSSFHFGGPFGFNTAFNGFGGGFAGFGAGFPRFGFPSFGFPSFGFPSFGSGGFRFLGGGAPLSPMIGTFRGGFGGFGGFFPGGFGGFGGFGFAGKGLGGFNGGHAL